MRTVFALAEAPLPFQGLTNYLRQQTKGVDLTPKLVFVPQDPLQPDLNFLTVEALDLQIREDINALFSLLPRDFCLAESRVEAFDNCGVPLRCTSYFLLSHFRFRRQARESVYRGGEYRKHLRCLDSLGELLAIFPFFLVTEPLVTRPPPYAPGPFPTLVFAILPRPKKFFSLDLFVRGIELLLH